MKPAPMEHIIHSDVTSSRQIVCFLNIGLKICYFPQYQTVQLLSWIMPDSTGRKNYTNLLEGKQDYYFSRRIRRTITQ